MKALKIDENRTNTKQSGEMMKIFMGTMVSFLVFLITLTACKDELPPKVMVRSVRAMQVSDPGEFTKRWFPGQAKATQEVDLAFRVAGPLVTFPVKVGDEVRKGQELAQIDPRDYEVNLRNTQGQLEKTRATLEKAQLDYQRVIRIKEQDAGAVSQALIDRSRQIVESTQAEIRSLKAAVDSDRDQLNYTYLKAPFDGIVSATYVENFENVTAKQPIVRLIDHSQIEMIVNIPETMIHQADYLKASGKALRVRFDQFPDHEIKAGILEIGKEASHTTRTYPITLIMDQPDDIKILPGMAGKATSAVAAEGKNTKAYIVIPETALFSPQDGNKSYVWVIDETTKKVSKREVKTDKLLDNGAAIEDGLKPGEWIATAGVHYLNEGQQVRILSQKSEEVAK